MAFFFKSYQIIVDKDYETTTQIFRDNFDDMTKKGYSLSGDTVLYNSDHNSKYFSGEYKNDHFVVRQTDNGTDDFYYKLLPKHEISFEKTNNNQTKVNVKSKSVIGLIIFTLFTILAIITEFIFYMLIVSNTNKLLLLLLLIPIVLVHIILLASKKQIDNTKLTLEYIFKK